MAEVYYTSDQLVLCLTKKGYELHRTPRRGRYFFRHRSRPNLCAVIVPVGRNDLSSDYVQRLLKNTPISFSDFKKLVVS